MIKSVLLNPVTAILFTIVAILSIVSMRQSLQPIAEGQADLERLQNDKTQLQARIIAAEQQLEAAQTPFYQEKKLRDEFLLQREGEIIILLPDVSPLPLPEPTPSPSPSAWEEWQSLLFR